MAQKKSNPMSHNFDNDAIFMIMHVFDFITLQFSKKYDQNTFWIFF